jgi:regulatory protein
MAFKMRGADSEEGSAPRTLSPERQEQRARNILLYQLSRSAKSTKQLREILAKREIDPAIAESVLERFTEVGLIDDKAFAETLVSSRRKFKGSSKSVIKRELSDKGIEPHIIEQVTSEISPESEIELACDLAARRIRQMTQLERDIRFRRLSGYLLRKGFSSSIVSIAVRHAEEQM